MAGQFGLVVATQRLPCLGSGELLDRAPLRPHHEVLDIHGRHHLVQVAGRAVAQLLLVGLRPVLGRRLVDLLPVEALVVQFLDQAQPRLEQARAQ